MNNFYKTQCDHDLYACEQCHNTEEDWQERAALDKFFSNILNVLHPIAKDRVQQALADYLKARADRDFTIISKMLTKEFSALEDKISQLKRDVSNLKAGLHR